VPVQPRHPIALAQQALSVQTVCGGRLALGLGVSHHWIIDEMLGLAYERAAPTMSAHLDVLEQAVCGGSVERARRVIRFKSAKYTIERPLHIGAALAGAADEVLTAYSAYGLPLGEAFQLRDDVLGVFGYPADNGKTAGDDLREGKRTVLVAMALERADERQAEVVRRLLGDPGLDADGVDRLRQVIEETGALTEAEKMIDRRTEECLTALEAAPVVGPARAVLTDLARAATARRV